MPVRRKLCNLGSLASRQTLNAQTDQSCKHTNQQISGHIQFEFIPGMKILRRIKLSKSLLGELNDSRGLAQLRSQRRSTHFLLPLFGLFRHIAVVLVKFPDPLKLLARVGNLLSVGRVVVLVG